VKWVPLEENNGGNVIIVYPPVGRHMVLDSLFDVIHAKGKIEGDVDMLCWLSLTDSHMIIEMKNRTDNGPIAASKLSESNYVRHISDTKIERKIVDLTMTVKISLLRSSALMPQKEAQK
jgi:hypothetical protein